MVSDVLFLWLLMFCFYGYRKRISKEKGVCMIEHYCFVTMAAEVLFLWLQEAYS